jgi:selenocysteine-specific elongation factor
MSREELRGRIHGDDAASARHLLEGLSAAGKVRLQGDLVALAAHRVELSDGERATQEAIESAFRGGGLNPPAIRDVLDRLGPARGRGEKLVPILARAGKLVQLPGGIYFHADAIAEVKRRLLERAPGGRPITVAEFKEWTGTSRKYAIPLLEHLDALRFTRRQGDARVVIGGPAA